MPFKRFENVTINKKWIYQYKLLITWYKYIFLLIDEEKYLQGHQRNENQYRKTTNKQKWNIELLMYWGKDNLGTWLQIVFSATEYLITDSSRIKWVTFTSPGLTFLWIHPAEFLAFYSYIFITILYNYLLLLFLITLLIKPSHKLWF